MLASIKDADKLEGIIDVLVDDGVIQVCVWEGSGGSGGGRSLTNVRAVI